MDNNNKILPALFILLFAVLCYFPLFLHLDHMSLRLWDEARRAVNAFEMAQNENLLVTHYDGLPEMWGTKPPLLIWCQSFLMKTIGYNEIAVRLPSALAALATIVLLVLFSWKILKRPLAGFMAGLVLLATKGYVGAHVARSGDFDSLLTLWETSYLLAFFTFFCHYKINKKKKWLYLTALFIALASLTKGVAGFLFMPGILLFVLIFGVTNKEDIKANIPSNIFNFISWKYTWRAVLIALVPIISFYILRETYNPGYISAVLENEVGGRYLEAKGGHGFDWRHYIKWLHKENFVPWLFYVPLALLVGFWEKGRLRYLTWLLLINSIIFLAVISISKTKILWYMAPVYPSLALLVGIAFERVISGTNKIMGGNDKTKYAVIAAFTIAVFWLPYKSTIGRVYMEQHPKWDWPELKYRDFMKQIKGTKDYTIVHGKYNSHVEFYKKINNLDGDNIKSQPMLDFDLNKYEFGKGVLNFKKGDKLMVCEKKVAQALDAVYLYKILWEWDTCKLVEVTGQK